jgi:hypothetical protein
VDSGQLRQEKSAWIYVLDEASPPEGGTAPPLGSRPRNHGNEPLPPPTGAFLCNSGLRMKLVCTESIAIYRTKPDFGWVVVAL